MLRSKKGFTLLEIVVASILMSVIMAGLASLYFGSKRWILHSRMRTQAAELSRNYMDILQMQVNQTNWPANCLGAGLGCNNSPLGNPGNDQLEGILYGRQFDFVAVPGVNPNLRKVRFTLSWNELQ